jgi:hypothetical protein
MLSDLTSTELQAVSEMVDGSPLLKDVPQLRKIARSSSKSASSPATDSATSFTGFASTLTSLLHDATNADGRIGEARIQIIQASVERLYCQLQEERIHRERERRDYDVFEAEVLCRYVTVKKMLAAEKTKQQQLKDKGKSWQNERAQLYKLLKAAKEKNDNLKQASQSREANLAAVQENYLAQKAHERKYANEVCRLKGMLQKTREQLGQAEQQTEDENQKEKQKGQKKQEDQERAGAERLEMQARLAELQKEKGDLSEEKEAAVEAKVKEHTMQLDQTMAAHAAAIDAMEAELTAQLQCAAVEHAAAIQAKEVFVEVLLADQAAATEAREAKHIRQLELTAAEHAAAIKVKDAEHEAAMALKEDTMLSMLSISTLEANCAKDLDEEIKHHRQQAKIFQQERAEHASAIKQARGEVQNARLASRVRVTSGVIVRMQHRLLAMGFRRWHDCARDVRRAARLFRRYLSRWQQANVVVAINRWRSCSISKDRRPSVASATSCSSVEIADDFDSFSDDEALPFNEAMMTRAAIATPMKLEPTSTEMHSLQRQHEKEMTRKDEKHQAALEAKEWLHAAEMAQVVKLELDEHRAAVSIVVAKQSELTKGEYEERIRAMEHAHSQAMEHAQSQAMEHAQSQEQIDDEHQAGYLAAAGHQEEHQEELAKQRSLREKYMQSSAALQLAMKRDTELQKRNDRLAAVEIVLESRCEEHERRLHATLAAQQYEELLKVRRQMHLRAVARVVVGMQQRMVWKRFLRWCEYDRDVRRAARVVRRYINRRQQAKVAVAINRWRCRAAAARSSEVERRHAALELAEVRAFVGQRREAGSISSAVSSRVPSATSNFDSFSDEDISADEVGGRLSPGLASAQKRKIVSERVRSNSSSFVPRLNVPPQGELHATRGELHATQEVVQEEDELACEGGRSEGDESAGDESGDWDEWQGGALEEVVEQRGGVEQRGVGKPGGVGANNGYMALGSLFKMGAEFELVDSAHGLYAKPHYYHQLMDSAIPRQQKRRARVPKTNASSAFSPIPSSSKIARPLAGMWIRAHGVVEGGGDAILAGAGASVQTVRPTNGVTNGVGAWAPSASSASPLPPPSSVASSPSSLSSKPDFQNIKVPNDVTLSVAPSAAWPNESRRKVQRLEARIQELKALVADATQQKQALREMVQPVTPLQQIAVRPQADDMESAFPFACIPQGADTGACVPHSLFLHTPTNKGGGISSTGLGSGTTDSRALQLVDMQDL